MKFLVDAQLPSALARYLSDRGDNVIHVLAVQMMESLDSEIWDFSLRENLVIITKDEDFQMRASVSSHFPKIIWVRIGNCSKKRLLEFFGKKWEQIKLELESGANLVEIIE